MKAVLKKYGIVIIIGVLIVGIAGYLLFKQFAPGSKYGVIKPLANFELENIDGSMVSLENTNGKARLVYFFFSSCRDVCQPSTHLLYQVQKELKERDRFGDDTALISITFDPERDTTERLKEFAEGYHADLSGWYFLRGDVDYSRDIAQKYDVAVIDLKDGNFGHSNFFLLVDKEGNLRHRYILGTDDALESIDPEEIAKDLIDLAKE